jgi:sugar phosphate isomerase/epimerase
MIKLAAMSSVCPDWTLDEVFAGMKRHGYRGFEPRVEWEHACGIELDLTAEGRRELAKRFADEEFELCCIATGVRMAAEDTSERAGHVDDLRRYIDLAADLSCPFLRTFGGVWSHEREIKAMVDYMVEGYSQVLDEAQDRGVTVLLETHDHWSNSISVRAVLEQANHPRLRALWDIMHPQRVFERPQETFEVLKPYVVHTHAHDGTFVDGKMTTLPLGAGIFDHFVPLQLLSAAGFDGYFAVEIIHAPGSDHDPDGVLNQYATEFRKMLERIE